MIKSSTKGSAKSSSTNNTTAKSSVSKKTQIKTNKLIGKSLRPKKHQPYSVKHQQFDTLRRKNIEALAKKNPLSFIKQAPVLISEINNSTFDFYHASDFDIELQDFDTYALNIIAILQQHGYEAYIVGGAIRDLLINKRPKDFDLVTNASPEQIKYIFPNIAYLIGRRFIIVHIRGPQNEIYECSTFRKAAIHAYQKKIVTLEHDNNYGNLVDDVTRRDFTINCLYFDPISQLIIDPYKGIKHLEQKRLVMIGEPKERFKQDPVRIIRAIRFIAKLNFEMDQAIAQEINSYSHLLAEVPQMRLLDELNKMMLSGSFANCHKLLHKYQLFKYFFPSLINKLEDINSLEYRYLALGSARSDYRVNKQLGLNPSFIHSLIYYPNFIKQFNLSLREVDFAGKVEEVLITIKPNDEKLPANKKQKKSLKYLKLINNIEQQIAQLGNLAKDIALINNEAQLNFRQIEFIEDIWLKQLQLFTLIDHLNYKTLSNYKSSVNLFSVHQQIKLTNQDEKEWFKLINDYQDFSSLRKLVKPTGFFNIDPDTDLTAVLHAIFQLFNQASKEQSIEWLQKEIKILVKQNANIKNLLIYLDKPSARAATNLLDIQINDLHNRYDVEKYFPALQRVNIAWQLLNNVYNLIKQDVMNWSKNVGVFHFTKK